MGELAVDGVIVILEVHLLDAGTVTLPPGVHVVVVDSDAGDRYSVVDTDQADGARLAVRHLLDLGHRTVWHVTGPRRLLRQPSAAPRPGGRAGAGRPAGPPGRCTATGPPSPATPPGCALADRPDCTAVFAANDQMALGLLRAFHERGPRGAGRRQRRRLRRHPRRRLFSRR